MLSHDRMPLAPAWMRRPYYPVLKRLCDLLVASLLLVLLAPVFVGIALALALTGGKVLFRQRRIGRFQKPFCVYKFRTMLPHAEQHGPQITASDDPRITPLGRFLRQTKLDELPQLLNVVKGEMSLVGPRPQVPRFVEHFPEAEKACILSVRPGITGPTQLAFRWEEQMLAGIVERERYYLETLLPRKCALDVGYVQNASLLYDGQVLGQTLVIFVRGVLKRLFRNSRRATHEIAEVASAEE